jgi:hypothetical protein
MRSALPPPTPATQRREADLFLQDLLAPAEDVGAAPASPPAGPAAIPSVEPLPGLQIVMPTGAPLANARWGVHQNEAVYQGMLDREGATGPLGGVTGRFDPSLPFRIHVEGSVCSIVSGAALLARAPEVEYGGQLVDWSLADHPDPRTRTAFWKEYAQARAPRGPLGVFRFLQHDHVMRRPVKLLAPQGRAVFDARPLAIRLGPIVRYTDTGRALIWLELETPGLVRVTCGKATNQRELPAPTDTPSAPSPRYATSVRVGGRHYALVWLDGLEPDTAYQYTIALAPQPASGPLPMAQGDFTEAVFPREPTFWSRSNINAVLKLVSLSDSEWLFFRTAPARSDALRFAHGSCRKWPGDDGRIVTAPAKDGPCRRWQGGPPHVHEPGPDMLEAFGAEFLATTRNWAEWPRFFLHTGDQIYADDVGVAMGAAILGERFASVVAGPAPRSTGDVAFGAWAGRFGWRYATMDTAAAAPRADLDELCALRPQPVRSSHDVDFAMRQAVRARAQAAFSRRGPSLPLPFKLRVLNGLLWEVPVEEDQVPRVDKRLGLLAPQVYRLEGPPARDFRIEHASAGDTGGVHAADFAEYAALYEQAWVRPGARRVLAHLPSFMIFDDHEVTDDWNADPVWLRIVHSKADPYRYWPTTITDALCAYWIYQGWGNLGPEEAARDRRVEILERCRRQGRDALPELRRLVWTDAVEKTAPHARPAGKLDWNFALPTPGLPFLAIDLRTDRDVNGGGGMSGEKLRWIEDALTRTTSPVAFLVLPVPYLMPDPMLFAFRHPGFVSRLAGARSERAFKLDADIEHPAGNPVWNQIKGLLGRLQRSGKLKTVVILSGDIHFSCNLDGQLPGSGRPPRLLQLVSSGLRQSITAKKQGQLVDAYKGWLFNLITRSQGVDVHRDVRITLGGMRGRGDELGNFLFQPSVAVVDLKMVFPGGNTGRTPAPLVTQTHLSRDARGAPASFRFLHMTHPNGKAFMTLKDPGFEHPASPKDYPAAAGGLGFTFEAKQPSSLEPGQSLRIDGQNVGTYVDAVSWYTARRDVLLGQQQAFAKDKYPSPPGLDDLVRPAEERIKAMGPLGTQPLGDRHVEEMLVWLDRYLEVLPACDRQMEVIAVDRYRATRAAVDDFKEQVARLQPRMRDLQRSAFRADDASRLKQSAETFATVLDSLLVAEQWVRDAATKMEDIKVLGTTLRAQKALHGWPQPWHELMRKTTDARIAKLLSVADGLNKVLAAWQLVDAGLTLLAGGKTASDRGSAGVSFAVTAASAGGTLLGASGFFSLYTNLYLAPMVKHILGQIDVLKDRISTGRNHPYIQLGRLDLVNWDLEPGGREMYEFMHGVMKARGSADIKTIPGGVNAYFSKHRRAFDAGTPRRRGLDLDYADFTDKRDWVFGFRDDIWGMVYGSMPVPARPRP